MSKTGMDTVQLIMTETLFAGIAAVGGAALSYYTSENTNPIWPFAYSVVSVVGTCTIIRNANRVRRSAWYKDPYDFYPLNMGTGTIIYFSSLYAFSESWKCNNLLWIPCLGTTAGGLYYAASSRYRTRVVYDLKPLSTCCELVFNPLLIGLGASYLLYFRNHDEEWLKWLPLVLIMFNSFLDIDNVKTMEVPAQFPILLQLKGIQMFMGGCLHVVSGTVLTIYFFVKEYHWMLRAFVAYVTCNHIPEISAGIYCILKYIGMDKRVSFAFGGLATGFTMILWSILVVQYTGNMILKCMFAYSTTNGFMHVCVSTYRLSRYLSRPMFIRYTQRTLGLVLTVCSSVGSAYVAYHMGWRYSLMMMPLTCTGIYLAQKGFRK